MQANRLNMEMQVTCGYRCLMGSTNGCREGTTRATNACVVCTVNGPITKRIHTLVENIQTPRHIPMKPAGMDSFVF